MALALRVKAEVVLAVQLVSRHRTVRLAAFLALLFTGAVAGSDGAGLPGRLRVALMVAGTLGAIAGSRLLAPGGALTAARITGGAWWLAPAGRLLGAACVVLPLSVMAASVLVGRGALLTTHLGVSGAAAVYALVAIALASALTPVTGASASAALVLLAAWVGSAAPSDLSALFAGVSLIRSALVPAWSVLPLPWRAARWVEQGTAVDAIVLAGWMALAVVAAGWSVSGYPRAARTDRGSR